MKRSTEHRETAEIVRLVRMSIRPADQAAFQSAFNGVRDAILRAPGCRDVRLMRDPHHRHLMVTFSVWSSEDALNVYRRSDVFRRVWPRVKALFAEPPSATSYRILLPAAL